MKRLMVVGSVATSPFEGHLVSPLTYGEKVCLAYDDSKCDKWSDGEFDFEECPDSYEVYKKDVWAEGTKFQYDCLAWRTRLYRHALQYTVRHVRLVDIGEGMERVELEKVVMPVPRCD